MLIHQLMALQFVSKLTIELKILSIYLHQVYSHYPSVHPLTMMFMSSFKITNKQKNEKLANIYFFIE